MLYQLNGRRTRLRSFLWQRTKLSAVCFYHIRRRRQIGLYVVALGRSPSVFLCWPRLRHVLITVRSVLAGLPESTLEPLHSTPHLQLITSSRPHPPTMVEPCFLLWFNHYGQRIRNTMQYKLCTLMHMCPQQPVSDVYIWRCLIHEDGVNACMYRPIRTVRLKEQITFFRGAANQVHRARFGLGCVEPPAQVYPHRTSSQPLKQPSSDI